MLAAALGALTAPLFQPEKLGREALPRLLLCIWAHSGHSRPHSAVLWYQPHHDKQSRNRQRHEYLHVSACRLRTKLQALGYTGLRYRLS